MQAAQSGPNMSVDDQLSHRHDGQQNDPLPASQSTALSSSKCRPVTATCPFEWCDLANSRMAFNNALRHIERQHLSARRTDPNDHHIIAPIISFLEGVDYWLCCLCCSFQSSSRKCKCATPCR